MKQENLKAPDPQRYKKFEALFNWGYFFSRFASILIVVLSTLYVVHALADLRLEVNRLTKENQQLHEKCH